MPLDSIVTGLVPIMWVEEWPQLVLAGAMSCCETESGLAVVDGLEETISGPCEGVQLTT